MDDTCGLLAALDMDGYSMFTSYLCSTLYILLFPR